MRISPNQAEVEANKLSREANLLAHSALRQSRIALIFAAIATCASVFSAVVSIS